MEILKRQMTAEIDRVEERSSCQASFNSDGVLTLRHKSLHDPNHDIIIVLSRSETEAIFKLLREMKDKISMPDLPF